MNKRLVFNLLGNILLIESACMLPAAGIALIHRDGGLIPMLLSAFIAAAAGLPLRCLCKPKQRNLRAREGFITVALCWIALSLFGSLPFLFAGTFTNPADAIFEAVSGFTTTGASVLNDFDGMPRGVMFWRSFTHWIGGMGVLVLTLALLPQMSGHTSHLIRAESPGPVLSKIVPKMGDSAKILYIIYLVLTLVEFGVLMLAGMTPYDAAIHAMGTAGTGGFSSYGTSIAAFNSAAIDWIITVFMLLFGINFALFYHALIGDFKSIWHNDELRLYLGCTFSAIIAITLLVMPRYGTFMKALRYSAFQCASVVSTTGYVTANFDVWPTAAKMIILLLMFMGSCAGSTAGGMKVIRVLMLFRSGRREILHTFQTRKVQTIRIDGKGIDESLLYQTGIFAFVYIILVLAGSLLVSLDGRYDLLSNLTAALTCVSNVGPGLGAVGPIENFAGFSNFSKIVLSVLMLAGRLELFPILVLFHPGIWKKA